MAYKLQFGWPLETVTVFQMPAIVAKLHVSSPHYLNKLSETLH